MTKKNDTVGDLIAAYDRSRERRLLAEATRRNTDKTYRWLAPLKDRELNSLTQRELIDIIDGLSDGSAHIFISRARALFSFARARGMMITDPLNGVHSPKSGEYRPWTEDEVRAFVKAAPPVVGMAVRLGYYTGQRLSDVLTMRWDDIHDGAIRVTQQKTSAELDIPIHPRLKAALRDHAKISTGETIIADSDGGPYRIDTFRRKFSDARKQAGLPKDMVFHGLRKMTAVNLAEGGASTQEIMSIGGWKTSKQVDHYCKGARQRVLAQSAMKKLRVMA